MRRGNGIDTCTVCGIEDLYGTEGTEEHPGEWVLVCQRCGHIQGKRKRAAGRS